MSQLLLSEITKKQTWGHEVVIKKLSQESSNLTERFVRYLKDSLFGKKKKLPCVKSRYNKSDVPNFFVSNEKIFPEIRTTSAGILRENICIENKLMEIILSLDIPSTESYNLFTINNKQKHFTKTNQKALGVVLKSLLYYINQKNRHQEIKLEVFEDTCYNVIVVEHTGNQISNSAFKNLYQASPSMIADFNDALLYSSWHIIKAAGGWLTSGIKNERTKYISVGIPI